MSSSTDTTFPSHIGSNRICRRLHISQLKYDSIYVSVERAMIQRDLLGRSLKTKASKDQLRHITRDTLTIFEDVLSGVPEEDRTRAIALVAQRCNHNSRRRKQTEEANGYPYGIKHPRRRPAVRDTATTTQHGINNVEFKLFSWVTVEADNLQQPALITSHRLLEPGRSPCNGIRDLSFDRFLDFLVKELSFRPGIDELYCWIQNKKRNVTSEDIWHSALENLTRQGELEPGFTIGRHADGRAI